MDEQIRLKDFGEWHIRKNSIELQTTRNFFHERELWWCVTGINIGSEQDGKNADFSRPVLIFRKFNNEIFWSTPLSTSAKIGKFYTPIFLDTSQRGVAVISQLRLLDAKRLIKKIGTISKENYDQVKKKVMDLCDS